ncbi:hypothetical protein CALCODRAFT_495470 [Calocera cornea HHB12733]|uniref:Uncharacterized protein n=1 Tax=Calocera cornea HHB12733 TaxID=1353952 RepID=A0A165GFF0_9BASI|nr:hypothetical protein CALCODRAFT_495470 [Calocera cornea HHB12733]
MSIPAPPSRFSSGNRTVSTCDELCSSGTWPDPGSNHQHPAPGARIVSPLLPSFLPPFLPSFLPPFRPSASTPSDPHTSWRPEQRTPPFSRADSPPPSSQPTAGHEP